MVKDRQPYHDLDLVKSLVSKKKYRVTKRVSSYLLNHGYVDQDIVQNVISSISLSNYYKTNELEHISGAYADIYRHVTYDGEEWYVKLFIDEDQNAYVNIWSLKEEGYGF